MKIVQIGRKYKNDCSLSFTLYKNGSIITNVACIRKAALI